MDMKLDDTFCEIVNRIITTKYPMQFWGLSSIDDSIIAEHCYDIIIKQKNKIIIDDDFIQKFLAYSYVEVDSFLVDALFSVFCVYDTLVYNKIHDGVTKEEDCLVGCDITIDFDLLYYEELLYQENNMVNGLKNNISPDILINLIRNSNTKKLTINKSILGTLKRNNNSYKSILDILEIPIERAFRDIDKILNDRMIKINNINVKKIKNEKQ